MSTSSFKGVVPRSNCVGSRHAERLTTGRLPKHSVCSSDESDLRVSLVNNGLVGPYSATVLVTLPSAPDHRPPHLAFAR
ncbi:hypothetical protein TNCV_892141 [Trichonephila clavipes]|nr:hypothetical protein TNCV_892141 [Trichonephila clavipes]